MCASGVSAREAWQQCGQPNGEKGIQNIRKAGRKLALERAAPATPAAETPAAEVGMLHPQTGPGPGKGKPVAGFRLRPDQVARRRAADAAARAAYDAIYKEATAAWADAFRAGKTGKGSMSAEGFAAAYAGRIPEGFTLTGRMLTNALRQGRSGVAQRRPGPAPTIPKEFVESISSYAQLRQVAGDEQTPRMLGRVAVSAATGSAYESQLATASQRAHLLKRVRRSQALATATACAVDDRRWQWLTSSNLTTWFEGYKRQLLESGFIDDIPSDKFEVITVEPRKAARMLNADETHQKLSNEGEARGPRAHVYINPKLGRAGKRKVTCQKHATFMAWLTYDGQVGSPHIMLATDSAAAKKGSGATQEEIDAIRMRPEWTFGVPRVIGKFGCDQEQTWEPTFIMSEKGGMESGGLEQFLRSNVLPKFPDISQEWKFAEDGSVVAGPIFFQLDAGPDRLTEVSLDFRREMWDMGLILFPGLPNGTAANQVCDDLFGTYKTGCDQNADDIVAERIKARDAAATSTSASTSEEVNVKLDFCDIGRIMNGKPGDPIERRPFERAFTPEKIVASVAKLGLNPIDLNQALGHKRVRDDSETGTRMAHVAQVRAEHAASLQKLPNFGIQATSALEVVVPQEKRPMVAPPSSHEEEWRRLKEAGSSIGAVWQAVGAKAFNAPAVTGPALERVQDRLQQAKEKEARQLSDLSESWAAAKEVYSRVERDGTDYMQLSAGDLKALVSYCHRVKKQLGVGEHTKTKAAAAAYLNALGAGALKELITNPPESVLPVALAVPLVDSTDADPLLALEGPAHLLKFGDPGCELPEGLLPVSAPPWLAAACETGSSTAGELVDKLVLYKWPPRLGGWAVGKVTGVMTSDVMVNKVKCNYSVFYECDQETADHVLAISKYAKSAKSPADSWVLLG